MTARRGVTLTELLAVTGGISCLLALLLPAAIEVKGAAERTRCAVNLSQLGTALHVYAAEHDGYLPDCGAASGLAGSPVPGRWNARGTCNWPRVKAVGNQANLWLLVRGGYAEPGLFVCPATPDRPSLNAAGDPTVMGFLALDDVAAKPTAEESRFLSRIAGGRCSYSYQNQFVHPDVPPSVADPRNATTCVASHPASLAVVADRNPYTRPDGVRQPIVSPDDLPEANSLNHEGAGQNVLYLGGEVVWQDTPVCGPMRPDGTQDNIYWPDEGRPDDPENVPRTLYDSYLVP